MPNLLQLLKTYDDFLEKSTGATSPAPKVTATGEPAGPQSSTGGAGGPQPAVVSEPPRRPPVGPWSAPTPPPAPAAAAPPAFVAPLPAAAAPPGFVAPLPAAAAPPALVSPPMAGAAAGTQADTAQAASDTLRSDESPDPEALYRQALLSVSRMFEAAVMENIAPGRLLATVGELEELAPLVVEATAASRGLTRQAMGTYVEGEGFVLPHSVNVGILAVELGRELGLEGQSLLDLCLAGFVHDIGSVQMPPRLLTKSESLTPSEWETMRLRPTYSYEALCNLGSHYERIAEITLQVYERLDGSGYPRGLQGDEILPEARILGTVDFFESFAHPRPYKNTLPGTANHGIQMLMQMADKFGAATLKALIGSIGLFPIGSYVRLSSGEIGHVVDVERENPMRPVVEVLLTAERQPPRKPRVLDLLGLPQIYVSRALTGSDLRELGLLPAPSDLPFVGGRREGNSPEEMST